MPSVEKFLLKINLIFTIAICCEYQFYHARDGPCSCVLQRSSAAHASKTYRIVQQIPSDSSEDDVSGSDDEWLPEKRELENGSSSDSEAEDVEGAEDAEEVEGAEEDVGVEDVLPDKAQVHKKKVDMSGKSKIMSLRETWLHFQESGR